MWEIYWYLYIGTFYSGTYLYLSIVFCLSYVIATCILGTVVLVLAAFSIVFLFLYACLGSRACQSRTMAMIAALLCARTLIAWAGTRQSTSATSTCPSFGAALLELSSVSSCRHSTNYNNPNTTASRPPPEQLGGLAAALVFGSMHAFVNARTQGVSRQKFSTGVMRL